MTSSFKSKSEAREYVWNTLTEQKAAAFPFPVKGRIPNFVGAKLAADRLLTHPIWEGVTCVKCNPDSPQRSLREALLRRSIRYVFPTPRLKAGFFLFDPEEIPKDKYGEAATLKTCMAYGQKIALNDLPKIDLAVTGSVAVTEQGYRCGKGHGYGDLEYGIYTALGHPAVPVVTTVHDLQIVKDFTPDAHDLPVTVIATPTKIIEVNAPPKAPQGIYWELLSDEDLDEMPILKDLKMQQKIL